MAQHFKTSNTSYHPKLRISISIMAAKLPMGPIAYPDPADMLAKNSSVDEYFDELSTALVANFGGNNITQPRIINIIGGLWSSYPVLQTLYKRLTPAQLANVANLREAVKTHLFPDGEQDLFHQLLQKFYARKQELLETPVGSGNIYPEPAIAYTSDKIKLISKIPAAQQPTPQQQVHSIIDNLQQPLRQQTLSMANPFPPDVDTAVRITLRAERAVSAPPGAPPVITNAAQTFQ